MRNFAAEVVGPAPERTALVELTREGQRRVWTFAEVARAAGSLSTELLTRGVGTGDTVMILIGNRAEWVLSILAGLRIGATVLPCTEQLRANDLAWRLQVARPKIIVADERNRKELQAARPGCPIMWMPDDDALARNSPPPAVDLPDTHPAVLVFTSGTSGKPKAVIHTQQYLWGQGLQAEHWLGPAKGELTWCTAASGWSKSARNAFIAPWLRGAAGLLHDARFDPEERLEVIRRENVNVLCMSPTEYRVIARRARLQDVASLRRAVAAGETLDGTTFEAWRESCDLEIIDGYGQTETGHLTYSGGRPVRGSMGFPLPGVHVWVHNGELIVDPKTVPTFFASYLEEEPPVGPWHTGDHVEQDEDGRLWFRSRADDIIVSSGYRIGPSEVEEVLLSHPAVADAAVVGAPDAERGELVRAYVALKGGWDANDELVRLLQAHVKAKTAPYKYPRDVRFVIELPRTPSGKLQRQALRDRF